MKLEKLMSTAFLVPKDDPASDTCRWGLPILLWGPPGIGKSARIDMGAKMMGLSVETVYAATKQPEDLSGAPVPDGKGGVNVLCVLSAARRLMQDQVGVLFIDELSTAAPAVQGAFLSLVLEGRVGDEQLPPGIRIIGAANPPENAAGGWDLEPPMANRFMHFTVSAPPADEWVKWLFGERDEDPEMVERGEERIRQGWSAAFSRAKGLIGGFMTKKKSSLYNLPPEGNESRGRAWQSPRTWEMATRSYAACLALKHDELCFDFVQACVGEGAAAELAEYIKEANLPDPLDMLISGWKPDKRRLDIVFAAYASMAAFITTQPESEKKRLGPNAWKRLKEAQELGLTDLVISPARVMVIGGLRPDVSPEIHEMAIPVLATFGKKNFGKYVKA